jgi:hypothetical protein
LDAVAVLIGGSEVIHTGSCHCAAVSLQVEAPEDIEAYECTCSMCKRTAFLHLIVPASRFQLLSGADVLTTYIFNTGTAKHLFCRICGVKAFYVPRSNPDGFSVNVRCLDQATVRSVKVLPFDGENWEANGNALAQLSKER